MEQSQAGSGTMQQWSKYPSYACQVDSKSRATNLVCCCGGRPHMLTILYSWWTSHSYKAALVFASSCSILGNIFYALGLPFNSLPMVMVGRLLNGFGSARSINRR